MGDFMVKPKIEGETKKQKFKRIAEARTRRVLKDLRLLGNCANKQVYEYEMRDVRQIFSAIEKETRRVRALFVESKERGFTLG